MAAGWLVIAYFATRPSDAHVLYAGAVMLFFGVLVFVALAYVGTMRQEYALAVFRSRGWVYCLMSRRLLRGCTWLLFAMAMAFVLFLQLHTYRPVEWGVLSLTLAVLPATFVWFRRASRAEMRKDMADSMALLLATRTCPLVMAVVYVLATASFGELPRYESLGASIDAYQTAPTEWSGSELIKQGLYWSAYFDGLKAYAVSHFGELGALPALALLLVATYAIYLGACLALTPLLVSPREFRRARLVPPWSATVLAVAAITISGAYALDSLDRWVTTSPLLRDLRVTVEKASIELIDGRFHPAGTHDEIIASASGYSQRVKAEVDVFRDRLGAMFETLEKDAVTEYLDWYYSPTGAALRLLDSVGYAYESLSEEPDVAEFDSHMADHLEVVFGRQFPDVNAAHAAISVAWEREVLRFGRDARDILAENRLVPVPRDYEVTWEGSLDNILASALPGDSIPPGAAGATAAAGGLSAQIVRTFVKSALRKPAFKTAGRSLTSAVKAATKGLLKGLLGGVVAILGIEMLSLELEEALNRTDFERQLIDAIREARLEFERAYFGVVDEAPSGKPRP